MKLKWKWVRSRNRDCLVTWFCYKLTAKPGNKTATCLWPDQNTIIFNIHYSGVTWASWRLREGHPVVIGGFPSQRARNAEKIPCHEVIMHIVFVTCVPGQSIMFRLETIRPAAIEKKTGCRKGHTGLNSWFLIILSFNLLILEKKSRSNINDIYNIKQQFKCTKFNKMLLALINVFI